MALSNVPRGYWLLVIAALYVLVLFANPVRLALRDGFRCVMRFKRIWLTFVLLGAAYSIFQFATFTPVQNANDLDLNQVVTPNQWNWPHFTDIWREMPLPTVEGVAGIFDNATTTYPLAFVAALLLLCNWRGLHGSLLVALQKRFRLWAYVIYLVVALSALAAIFKPIVFWRLPTWRMVLPERMLFQTSAAVDAVSFIFEYLFGVYVQVYLITVCLAWIKGLSFTELGLFQFAVRRFTYVLKWAGIVICASMVIVRLPLLLAYFIDLPGVLDYQAGERYVISALILLFCSVQISLVLHNESLKAAIAAHFEFITRNPIRLAWFLFICALTYLLLTACDVILRAAIADRAMAFIVWKTIYVLLRGFATGWLLAAWVCLFRQCETGRIKQETWIQY